jgi:hypothetical protein
MFTKKCSFQVSFYAVESAGSPHDGRLLAEATSWDKIIDIGSKDIGALQLHDVTPLKSCSRGGRKVVIISEYDLSAQTVPIFQLYNKQGKLTVNWLYECFYNHAFCRRSISKINGTMSRDFLPLVFSSIDPLGH